MSGAVDLLRARVRLRDRSVADVLDLALRFIGAHARDYGKVTLTTLVPLALLPLVACPLVGWRAVWALALPLAVAAEVPFTVLASRLVFEADVRARDVALAALRDGPRVVAIRLVMLTFSALGLAFFLIPGLWLATSTLFISEVMLLERASAERSLGRSQRVAASAVSDVVLGLFALGLIPVASILLADVAGRSTLGALFQFEPPRPVWAEGGSVLATIGLFAQVPYFATARFFLYLNVRTRAEGWDIQTRFSAIVRRAATERERLGPSRRHGDEAA